MGGMESRAFWLALPRHNQGLMSEACVPVTDFWFDVLNQPKLRVFKAAANVASRVAKAGHAARRHRRAQLRVIPCCKMNDLKQVIHFESVLPDGKLFAARRA